MKKKYKHKKENATAELCSDEYWYLIKFFDKNDNEINRFSIPKSLIENTNDWELIEEPQEKVIEGYIRNKAVDNLRYVHSHINFSEKQTDKNNIPATLILNPKKREEVEIYFMKKENIDLLINTAKITGESYNKNGNYNHKIKITIDD